MKHTILAQIPRCSCRCNTKICSCIGKSQRQRIECKGQLSQAEDKCNSTVASEDCLSRYQHEMNISDSNPRLHKLFRVLNLEEFSNIHLSSSDTSILYPSFKMMTNHLQCLKCFKYMILNLHLSSVITLPLDFLSHERLNQMIF